MLVLYTHKSIICATAQCPFQWPGYWPFWRLFYGFNLFKFLKVEQLTSKEPKQYFVLEGFFNDIILAAFLRNILYNNVGVLHIRHGPSPVAKGEGEGYRGVGSDSLWAKVWEVCLREVKKRCDDGEPSSQLFSRLSVILMRGNALMLSGRIPDVMPADLDLNFFADEHRISCDSAHHLSTMW